MTNPNPLLAGFKLPGRIFQLPSRGIFYHDGELDESVKNGEIHVHPMTALDEINMKNPDQLFSGNAVNTVFASCIPCIKKPSELLSKDVDAIMLFLRTVTYGPNFEFMAHHGCGPKDQPHKDYSYVANVDTIINEMKIIDPTIVDQLYTIVLPNKQVVKLRPNKYQQVIDLITANQNKKVITVDDQQKNLVTMLLGVIENVDGITDKDQITEWIKVIPAPSVNRIATKIESINDWGSSLKWACICKDCKETYEVEIPINPGVFFSE